MSLSLAWLLLVAIERATVDARGVVPYALWAHGQKNSQQKTESPSRGGTNRGLKKM